MQKDVRRGVDRGRGGGGRKKRRSFKRIFASGCKTSG
jgi:hypothetical protein